jgi:hypothetical protein
LEAPIILAGLAPYRLKRKSTFLRLFNDWVMFFGVFKKYYIDHPHMVKGSLSLGSVLTPKG